MTPHEIIAQLANRRVYLSGKGSTLKYRAPEDSIDASLRTILRQYKEQLLQTFQQSAGYQLLSPLSYNQQSMFFIYLLEPSSSAYNLALPMTLHSEVDIEKMKKAVQSLARRHEQLRTTYNHIEIGEMLLPVQLIHDDLYPSLEIIDAQDWSETYLTQQLQTFYQKPFELEKGPVVRAGLFIRSRLESTFIFAMHQIVSDGWSMNLLRRDLAAAYRGELESSEFSRGSEYIDFAVEQSL